jgi:hypothetical protein
MRQQTHLREQRCRQNKELSSTVRKDQTPFTDVSNTQQTGITQFHCTTLS